MEDPNTNLENQSDSDSSESWTFVDNTLPKIETQNQEVTSNSDVNSSDRLNKDPDDDTDGVAVITDDEENPPSDPVTTTVQEPSPIYQSAPFITMPPPEYVTTKKPIDFETSSSVAFNESEEELPSDFFMPNRKIKSYVHKRNNQVSSLLNFILIGALIIATTLAIGFTWGINDTCSMDVLDSVNGILVNLQKLQRENEMLKSKIRILRTMKYNKPIEKDIDFDKYLDYQMHLEQERILPKFAKGDGLDLIDNPIKNYKIVMDTEPPLINKEGIDLIESKLNKEVQSNNTYSANLEKEKDFDYKRYNNILNKHEAKFKPTNNAVPKNLNEDLEITVKGGHANQRLKRDTSKDKSVDMKSFCDNASNAHDKKKCSLLNKQNSETIKESKKDKYKIKLDDKNKFKKDKYKTSEDKANKQKPMPMENDQKVKRNGEKYSLRDKKKGKEVKKEFDGRAFNVPENQHHNHYNDNINADWYQKMYNGRKEIRDKGFDDYDLLDTKNKARWYFKRMNDREKNRWRSGDKFYRRHMRQEFFKNKF